VYTQYQPPHELTDFLESIWIYDPARAPGPASQSVVDNPGVAELVVQLGDKFRRYRKHDIAWIPRAALIGFMTRPCLVGPSGPVKTLGIRFRPGGVKVYSRVPGRLLANTIVDAWDVIDKRLLRSLLRIHELSSDEAIIHHIRAALIGCAADTPPETSAVRHFIGSLRPRFEESIAGFCRQSGISHRKLERQFNELVGVTPSSYARVQRFRCVLRRSVSDAHVRWIDMAADLGYADQAHLSREFKQFTGFSPTEYHKRTYHFSLEENSGLSSNRPLLAYSAGSVILF